MSHPGAIARPTREMLENFRLRRIMVEDAEQLASWDDPPTAVEDQRRIIVDQLLTPRALTFVAAINQNLGQFVPLQDTVLGWAMIQRGDEGDELRWLVAPRYRRMGVGSRIARILVALASRRAFAMIEYDNVHSQRVAANAGLVRHRQIPEKWIKPPQVKNGL